MNKTHLISITIICLFIAALSATLSFHTSYAKAIDTIYINADGSISPWNAPVFTTNNFTYVLTDDIKSDSSGIIIKRSNIILDGDKHTIQGSETGAGLYLDRINNVTIKNVNITGFYNGVVIYNSSYNKIVENNIMDQIYDYTYAVTLGGHSNIIYRNNITNNFCGIYLKNYDRVSVPFGYEYVVVCHSNIISENNISYNDWGIGGGDGMGTYSYNNTYSKNTIVNNANVGIQLYHAESNKLWGNTIANNGEAGVKSTMGSHASNNLFYHNTFVNNTSHVKTPIDVNIWDNGYPSGGNYWSDYSGVDLYSGVGQNETGCDGIGDSSYLIQGNNIDHYPLMGVSFSFNTSLDHHVNVVSNSNIEDFMFFEYNSTMRICVSNMTVDQTDGFCRMTIPHDVLSPDYTIKIDHIVVDHETIFENDTLSIIYFSYQHSTLVIIVVPEFPSLIFLPLIMITTLITAMIHRRRRVQRLH
jgi:parallel beta-helix repeat protein